MIHVDSQIIEQLRPGLCSRPNHLLPNNKEEDLQPENKHHHKQQQQQNESTSQGVNQFIFNLEGNFTGPLQINTHQSQGTQGLPVASQGKVVLSK